MSKGLKCLVIDDSTLMRVMISDHLTSAGIAESIDQASNGEEALARVSEGDPYDLIVVDWHMPQMDGIEFVREVRADPKFVDVCIVMVTSESGLDEYKAACKAGVDGYIPKPFDEEVLERKIKLLLEARSKK